MGLVTRIRRWLAAGSTEEPSARVAVPPGSAGQLSLRQELRLGSIVLRKGTYALSHTLAGDVDVLVLTAIDPRSRESSAAGRALRVNAHQFVMRATVFAEEFDDQSVRVQLVQITGDARVDGPAA